MSKVEILAPAGEWSALEAALRSGADAVYFGVGALNMRASARNFELTEIAEVVERCHKAGAQCYLAANTIVYQSELSDLDALLDAAETSGVDAVIASDFAVIDGARKRGLDVHASTQMSLSNVRSLAVLARNFGIRRFVLARECTLDDVVAIRASLAAELGDLAENIELEAFAHGAMCVAVSGRCFMSQFQYGKSANRGACLQPCRREYRVTNVEEDQEFDLGDHYVMSPKDLCVLPFVERLLEAGIVSLKIEGRNRSPEYVATVTSAYREVVDLWLDRRNISRFAEKFDDLKQKHQARIERVFHRGYSNGFYMGQPMDAWTRSGGSQASTRKVYVGLVTNYYARPAVAEINIQDNAVSIGDEVLFVGKSTGALEQIVESMQIEHVAVEHAQRGQLVAIKTPEPVRRGDKLYKIEPLAPPDGS
jgi:putative protease